MAIYKLHTDRTSYLVLFEITTELSYMENAASILSYSQIRVEINGDSVIVDVEDVECDPVAIEHLSGSTYLILFRGRSLTATLVATAVNYLEFSIGGTSYRCNLMNRRVQLLENLDVSERNNSHEGEISSPMPGLVVKILATEGARVKKDTPLIVLEAMKMENEIRSPIDAVVSQIHVSSGESVLKNALLVSLDALPIG